jgi:hypothetical protein
MERVYSHTRQGKLPGNAIVRHLREGGILTGQIMGMMNNMVASFRTRHSRDTPIMLILLNLLNIILLYRIGETERSSRGR